MIRVHTVMWGKAWERYGKKFVRSFGCYLPPEIELTIVSDGKPSQQDVVEIKYADANTITIRSLHASGYTTFMAEYGKHPVARGKLINEHWKDRERLLNYSWRYDALKWAPQLIAPAVAIQDCVDGDILVWLDADVEVTAPVPSSLFEELLGDADLSYLGRPGKWSEIGYWSIRVSRSTRAFVGALASLYDPPAVSFTSIFDLDQWHSAYAWDRVRERFEREGLVRSKNLTPKGRGHVWFQTRLGDYMDHMKGNRKNVGGSVERLKRR